MTTGTCLGVASPHFDLGAVGMNDFDDVHDVRAWRRCRGMSADGSTRNSHGASFWSWGLGNSRDKGVYRAAMLICFQHACSCAALRRISLEPLKNGRRKVQKHGGCRPPDLF